MKSDGRLVLLLEDDPQVVRVVEAALRREGLGLAAIGLAGDFAAAVARRRPDLILLDVQLPDGDGFEVCSQLRRDPANRQIPVIFLTAKNDAPSRLKGFACGAQDYVPKPFDPEELLARVRAHLDISRRLKEGELRVAEMTLRERFQRDLVDMVAHDLRSPLATVQLSLKLLADSGLISAAQHRRLLEVATDALDLSLVMVNDLLDLDAGRVAVRPAPLRLAFLVARLEAVLAPQFARRRVRFSCELERDIPELLSDEQLIFRVLMNLCGNALKFSPEGQTVTLRASHAGGRLLLEVSDRGPGIPQAERELIFDKYYRVEKTSRLVPGSGIGLSFCRLAAGALGGRVFVQDAPGGGSRFVLDIPAQAAPSAARDELFSPEIMREYLADCSADILKISAAVSAGEDPLDTAVLEGLRLCSHRLAGSAGTYGFPQVSAAAKKLEARSAAGATLKRQEALEALAQLRRGLGLAA